MNFDFVTGDEGIPDSCLYATAHPQGLTEQPLTAGARVTHGGL
jgi:hypothetical protein